MTDQPTALAAEATRLRDAVTALEASVPGATDRRVGDDTVVPCTIDPDDDSMQQRYVVGFTTATSDPQTIVTDIAIAAEDLGYTIRPGGTGPNETFATAVLDGQSITIRAQPVDGGLIAVGLLGNGACVDADGTVNGVSPQ